MFNPGDVVMHRLTSEWLMVLAQMPEEKPPGYTVRRASDYGFMNVAYFEVGVPKEEDNVDNNNRDSTTGNQEGLRGTEPVSNDSA